jgi:hypothetical protein
MSNNKQKKITLDPKYLSLSGGDKTKKTREKPRKYKNNTNHNSKTLRKKLIEKIKNYQNRREGDELTPPVKETSFDDEFSSSLEFLQELSNKKKQNNIGKNKALTKNKALPKDDNHHNIHTTHNIATGHNIATEHNVGGAASTPLRLIEHTNTNNTNTNTNNTNTTSISTTNQNRMTVKHKQPDYSCLKGGSRPTFRELKRMTQRSDTHTAPPHIKISIPADSPLQPSSVHNERSSKLEQIKSEYKRIAHPEGNDTNKSTKTKRCVAHKKIRTVKYKLGKTGTMVSVLIKNTDTRRRIKHEISLLRQKAITEVKQYLREKNLLKIGSDAPNDVLRKMYEQAILSGDLNNNNDATLMHNFMNDK